MCSGKASAQHLTREKITCSGEAWMFCFETGSESNAFFMANNIERRTSFEFVLIALSRWLRPENLPDIINSSTCASDASCFY